MNKIEENSYIGEERKLHVIKTRITSTTDSEKFRDVTSWNEVQKITRNTAVFNDKPLDFILWNNGCENGITIVGDQKQNFIINKCDFEIVKKLFIRDLVLENIDRLTLVKKHGLYQAKYKINSNDRIKNYIYEPCDCNNLSSFFESVLETSVSDHKEDITNGGLSYVTRRALKGIKGFTKHKTNRIRTYGNILK